MNVRSQISMVFHLDKCIGCHTCSVACKNHLDRPPGHRVHVVEQRRDQARHRLPDALGGPGAVPRRLGGGRRRACSSGQGEPQASPGQHLPQPRASRRSTTTTSPGPTATSDLFNAPAGDDQPTARPVSLVTGEADGHRGRARTGTTTSAARAIYAAQRSRTSPALTAQRARGSSSRSSGWSSSTCRASATTA